MGKYFGTDGFRGEANCTLTADHAFKVGRFLGWYYTQLKHQNDDSSPARIVIGNNSYGPSLPSGAVKGQIYFKLV